MDYRRADDELFGKYCYIDTPWIAGEKTIYRIIRSGVRSNAWCEVPVRGRNEIVTHDRYEDIVFVVLDTLIDEDTKIKRFALKDIEIIEIADRKTEPQTCNDCDQQRCETCVTEIGKTEPQTEVVNEFYANGELIATEVIKDEPQTESKTTGTDCSWK